MNDCWGLDFNRASCEQWKMDMASLVITVVVLAVLSGLIWNAATAEPRRNRIRSGWLAMAWASATFLFLGQMWSFNYNHWYSTSAKKLTGKLVAKLEEKEGELVLKQLKALHQDFRPSYESRGNFQALVERTVRNLDGHAPSPERD